MVTIISKPEGPPGGQSPMRRMTSHDRATITRIADHLTAGGFSAQRAAASTRPSPAPEPRSTSSRRPTPETARPYVRVSPNGRVVLADLDTARQLAFLGEVRRREGREVFVLATAENGFHAPLEAEVAHKLAALDGETVAGRGSARALSDRIATVLEIE